jgi:hypothetical protein
LWWDLYADMLMRFWMGTMGRQIASASGTERRFLSHGTNQVKPQAFPLILGPLGGGNRRPREE